MENLYAYSTYYLQSDYDEENIYPGNVSVVVQLQASEKFKVQTSSTGKNYSYD